MGLFDLFKGTDINQGVKEWKATDCGVLIDVRTVGEYRQGHIPGSMNIPLDEISKISEKILRKDIPLFVYCRSGVRSNQAVQFIRQLGYTDVKNIGGILEYRGEVEV